MDNDRLCNLKQGQCATIAELRANGSIRRRLQDIGFVEGTPVECLQKSPLGDPIAFLIRGAVIALRNEDSREIYIKSNIVQ